MAGVDLPWVREHRRAKRGSAGGMTVLNYLLSISVIVVPCVCMSVMVLFVDGILGGWVGKTCSQLGRFSDAVSLRSPLAALERLWSTSISYSYSGPVRSSSQSCGYSACAACWHADLLANDSVPPFIPCCKFHASWQENC